MDNVYVLIENHKGMVSVRTFADETFAYMAMRESFLKVCKNVGLSPGENDNIFSKDGANLTSLGFVSINKTDAQIYYIKNKSVLEISWNIIKTELVKNKGENYG